MEENRLCVLVCVRAAKGLQNPYFEYINEKKNSDSPAGECLSGGGIYLGLDSFLHQLHGVDGMASRHRVPQGSRRRFERRFVKNALARAENARRRAHRLSQRETREVVA